MGVTGFHSLSVATRFPGLEAELGADGPTSALRHLARMSAAGARMRSPGGPAVSVEVTARDVGAAIDLACAEGADRAVSRQNDRPQPGLPENLGGSPAPPWT